MKSLDLNRFPLTGTSLIEASAGTGKTFTIAGLYSRLLLGHNSGYERLRADQILVVTFTNAATEELRGRIRERIRSNLDDVLRMQADLPPHDNQFASWVTECLSAMMAARSNSESLDETTALFELAQWLQANLALMDSAAIFTIHGFAQRMLKQFAFDTGAMFSAELQLDVDELLRRAVEDVWRQTIYPVCPSLALFIRQRLVTPARFKTRIQGWLSRPDLLFLPEQVLQPESRTERQGQLASDPETDLATQLSQSWSQIEVQLAEARSQWQALGVRGLEDLINASAVSKRSYSKRYLPGWIDQLANWLDSEEAENPPASVSRFRSSVLQNATDTTKGEAPSHALFDTLEALLSLREGLDLQLVTLGYGAVKNRFFQLMDEAGLVSADDLLRLLDQALASEGSKSALLARQIRQLYPVAMIDEFQDTDPVQYRIFSRLYSQSDEDSDDKSTISPHGQEACGLVAIGDPKQAIYAFRGADIFTYIQARRRLASDQIYTLDTNWRSQTDLVLAVNRLFEGHPAPFVFDDDIPFHPVKASGRRDDQPLSVDRGAGFEAIEPLQVWFDEEELDVPSARQKAVAQCAEQIAALLAGAGRLGSKPVTSGDVAVLVRTRQQGLMVKQALAEQGVAAVMLSRDSVLTSLEARELLIWLTAVAEPSSERQVRSALATGLQGLSLSQLDALVQSESQWDAEMARMAEYHQLWIQRGIMAALMAWLNCDGRASRLATEVEGERRLTNLLHLGELLQSASGTLGGHLALVRWFGEKIQEAQEKAAEEALLRLETDANLVSIITIHRSKGLEYPLVFLPLLWSDSAELKQKKQLMYFDEKREQVVMNLAPDDDALEWGQRDEYAENMRLLYVALTRPRQGCFVWLMSGGKPGTKKQDHAWQLQLHQSAIGQLLQTSENDDWQSIDTAKGLSVGPFKSWLNSGYEQNLRSLKSVGSCTVSARPFAGLTYDAWGVSSFSRLTQGAQHRESGALVDVPVERLRLDDDAGSGLFEGDFAGFEANDAADSVLPMRFAFPRGSQAGTCLHSVLERWDFRDTQQLPDLVATALTEYGLGEQLGLSIAGKESDETILTRIENWLVEVVSTPLVDAFGHRFSLSELESKQRLDEMEFHLPVRKLVAGQLDQLLSEFAEPADGPNQDGQRSPRSLSFEQTHGYLKGFIDLVFEYQGRFYLLDYKSNFLGVDFCQYRADELGAAMASHYYDLQSWIYSLALDRYLALRIPGYYAEKHLGGVFYLFLRGMSPDNGLETFHQKRPSLSAPLTLNSHQSRQLDMFATGEAVVEKNASVLTEQQSPGVYYRSIDPIALAHWRQALLVDGDKDSAHDDSGSKT